MDAESFLEIANRVSKLPLYPYFEFCHCVVTCYYVKEDLGSGAHLFSRKHPLALFVSCLVSIYAGTFMTYLLLGEPLIGALKNENSLVLALIAWYTTFYSPFDVFYKLYKFFPVKLLLSLGKEFSRVRKVHDGVVSAGRVFGNNLLIMVIIGVVKGNGAAFSKMFERLCRGVFTPNAVELMSPSYPTKACIVAATIFAVDKSTDLFSSPHSLVYLAITTFFIYFKLSSVVLGIHDPFIPFENVLCALFCGGIWDTLQNVLTPTNKGDQSKSDASKNGKSESSKKKE